MHGERVSEVPEPRAERTPQRGAQRCPLGPLRTAAQREFPQPREKGESLPVVLPFGEEVYVHFAGWRG